MLFGIALSQCPKRTRCPSCEQEVCALQQPYTYLNSAPCSFLYIDASKKAKLSSCLLYTASPSPLLPQWSQHPLPLR